jgi:hypothetical protein
MPDPAKLLLTIRRAVTATRATPGRHGYLIRLPENADVMVTGDLHGNIANFQRILQVADLARQSNRHLIMQELIHGKFRYPDGSDKSHQAVDLWCALKCQYPARVHYLPGNHELAQWTNRLIGKGDEDLNASFLDGVRHAYGEHSSEVYAAYLELFASLPLALRTPNRVFISHSLPPPAGVAAFDASRLESAKFADADLQAGGFVYGLVWGRDTSAGNVSAFLTKVDAGLLISGHIPCDQGFAVPNEQQLILDCLGSPAACCLFPASETIRQTDLLNRIRLL